MERVDVGGAGVIATWRLSGHHTDAAFVNEDELLEPSGRRIDVLAITHVQFRGPRICAFSTTYDGSDLVEQLRERPAEEPP